MAEEQMPDKQERKDFLISYACTDRGWVEWIAATLEAEGYQTHLAAWDVRPGANVVLAIDEATKQAERTLLVLSAAYLSASDVVAEWTAAWQRDPQGKDGKKEQLPDDLIIHQRSGRLTLQCVS
jgi:hypothetical protein